MFGIVPHMSKRGYLWNLWKHLHLVHDWINCVYIYSSVVKRDEREKSKDRHDRTTDAHESLLSTEFKEAWRKFSGDLSFVGTCQKLQWCKEGLSDESVLRILHTGTAHMLEQQPRWACRQAPCFWLHLFMWCLLNTIGHWDAKWERGRTIFQRREMLLPLQRRSHHAHPKITMVPISELRRVGAGGGTGSVTCNTVD